MSNNDLRILEHVESLEKKQFKTRRFDPVDVTSKTGDHRDAGLLNKFPNKGRFSERAASPKMDDPVGETVVHHAGEFRQFNAVAVKVNSAGRTMKSKIENAVVSFAEQIEVVLKLLASVARQMAELRFHGLRDQLERR